ncbi:transposase [Bacillus thuringiensis]|nr:transposase [Bacillus thuringiensis]
MYELRKAFPVKALLKLAELPRSTYYYCIQNSNRPDKDKDKELKILIQNIYDEQQGRYGYRRIRDELMNQGHKINHKKFNDL